MSSQVIEHELEFSNTNNPPPATEDEMDVDSIIESPGNDNGVAAKDRSGKCYNNSSLVDLTSFKAGI